MFNHMRSRWGGRSGYWSSTFRECRRLGHLECSRVWQGLSTAEQQLVFDTLANKDGFYLSSEKIRVGGPHGDVVGCLESVTNLQLVVSVHLITLVDVVECCGSEDEEREKKRLAELHFEWIRDKMILEKKNRETFYWGLGDYLELQFMSVGE